MAEERSDYPPLLDQSSSQIKKGPNSFESGLLRGLDASGVRRLAPVEAF
jgi:hypothetical protein